MNTCFKATSYLINIECVRYSNNKLFLGKACFLDRFSNSIFAQFLPLRLLYINCEDRKKIENHFQNLVFIRVNLS